MDKLKSNNRIGHNVHCSRRWMVLKTIALFFFVYLISFPGLPQSVHSHRVVILLLFLAMIINTGGRMTINYKTLDKDVCAYWVWNAFLLLQSLFLILLVGRGTGTHEFNSYINMLIFLPMFYFGAICFIDSMDELLQLCVNVSVIQSVIVVLGIMSPNFLYMINSLFNADSYFANIEGGLEQMMRGGYAIGLSCITSTGSLQLSIGIIGCTYFLLKNETKKLPYIISFSIITFASVAVSRTGFLIAVVALSFVIAYYFKGGVTKFLKIVFAICAIVLVALFIIQRFNLWDDLSNIFNRLIRVFSEDKYVSGWLLDSYIGGDKTVIPPISIDTIIGTGISSGTSGNGITVNADGGFVRSYVAMGLIVAVINYLIIVKIYIKNATKVKKEYRWICLLMLVVFLIGEFKEPFVYKYYYIMLSLLCFGLLNRERNTLIERTKIQ